MQLFASLVLALSFALSFIPPSLAHAHQGRHYAHRQVDLARRSPGEIGLYKRDGARLSYYAVGLGACGQTNVPSDFIVALDATQFDQGSSCFQSITITANGKTASATIMDRCPGCPSGGLDLSQGLFAFFADISVGIIYGTWEYGSGDSSPSSSSSPPPPATSLDIPLTTLLASPTTTSQPPSATTTSSSPTSSSGYSSTTISANASSLVPTQTTAGIVSESTGPSTDGFILSNLNMVLVEFGRLLVASVGSS